MNIIKNLFGKKKGDTQVFDISLERMRNSFLQMEHEAGWNISNKMFWGYYFLDHDLKKLEAFGKKLKRLDFEIGEIKKVEENNLFLLHAEEHASYNPDSLFEQCHHLAQLAQDNEIQIFDGWDVEPIQMNKGLVE